MHSKFDLISGLRIYNEKLIIIRKNIFLASFLYSFYFSSFSILNYLLSRYDRLLILAYGLLCIDNSLEKKNLRVNCSHHPPLPHHPHHLQHLYQICQTRFCLFEQVLQALPVGGIAHLLLDGGVVEDDAEVALGEHPQLCHFKCDNGRVPAN